jgi:transposase
MYSNDLKHKAIQLYYKLNSYRKAAELLNIGKSTIQRWVIDKQNVKYNNELDMCLIIQFIKKIINDNCFITLRIIRKKIFNEFNCHLSLSLILTIIKKKLLYSYKRITKKQYSKSIEDLNNLKHKFLNKIKRISKNDIICVDETYLYSNYVNNYGWGKKSQKLVIYNKSNPIKYSIVMAITNQEIIYNKIYKQNITSNSFIKLIKYINKNYSNKYILLDNVSFHKTRLIRTIMKKSTNKLLYIPPYSPEFNPIEEVFSQLKRNIVKFNNKNILERLKKSALMITKNNLKNFYKNGLKKISHLSNIDA